MGRVVFGTDGTARAVSSVDKGKGKGGHISRPGASGQQQKGHKTAGARQSGPWKGAGRGGEQHVGRGGASQQHGKRKQDQEEEEEVDEHYRRALKRMEMGPDDENDSLSDPGEEMSDLSEEPALLGNGRQLTVPAGRRHGVDVMDERGRQGKMQQLQLPQQIGRKGGASSQGYQLGDESGGDEGEEDSDAGGEGLSDDDEGEEGGSDGSEEDEEEEVTAGGPQERSSKGGTQGRGALQQRPVLGGAGLAGDALRPNDDHDNEDDEDDEDDEDEDPDGAVQQLADLPLEMRLALLKDGSGPRGAVAQAAAREARAQEESFKRLNKHRPKEMSSKKPVSRFREVVEPVRKPSKDPRFARLVSDTDKAVAARRYAFLYDDVLAKEKNDLRSKMKAERKPGIKAALSAQLQRVEQAINREQQRRVSADVEAKVKAQQRSAVSSGKTPFFLKNSDKRKLELVAKYEQLKSKGKLDRFMEKRRKHNASKDHRYLPSGRRDEDE